MLSALRVYRIEYILRLHLVNVTWRHRGDIIMWSGWLTLQCHPEWPWSGEHMIMLNVTWRRFDQSAKQLVVGHTTIHYAYYACPRRQCMTSHGGFGATWCVSKVVRRSTFKLIDTPGHTRSTTRLGPCHTGQRYLLPPGHAFDSFLRVIVTCMVGPSYSQHW